MNTSIKEFTQVGKASQSEKMDNNGTFAIENWYIDFIDLQIGRKVEIINSLAPSSYADT